jgi:protein-S-isoprenylcysteine O-methyltransferase Ste14
MIFFVFKQNSYASRVVEVDNNQKVISTGLYGIVRHPMYVGVLIMKKLY